MVVSEHHTLEMSPETFNGVGSNSVLGELLLAVMEDSVLVSFLGKPCVGREFVREDIGIVCHKLLDNWHKGGCLRVGNNDSPRLSLPCYHTEDGSLRFGGTPLSLLRLLGFVLVRLPAAKVHLIHLHLSFKGGVIVLVEEGTHLVQNVPRGLLRHLNVPCQLMRGNALLVAADKVHCHKPLLQRQFRILKDGSHKTGKPLVTLGTLELIVAIPADIDMGATAMGADNDLTPTLLGYEITATLVSVEMIDEGDKGIEVF